VADSTEHVQIEYGVYAPSEGDAMARLLGEVFSRNDLPAVAVDPTAHEFEMFVRRLCPKVAAEGRTIVARDAGTAGLCLDRSTGGPDTDG